MRKYTELNLVNLANQLIQKHNLHSMFFESGHDFAVKHSRQVFGYRTMCFICAGVRKMNPKTKAGIARLILDEENPLPTEYRKLSTWEVTLLGHCDLHMELLGKWRRGPAVRLAYNAAITITAAIYEILATENVLRGGPVSSEYQNPQPKLEEFVRKVRLSRLNPVEAKKEAKRLKAHLSRDPRDTPPA